MWKDIKGYEQNYQVSCDGKIRSRERVYNINDNKNRSYQKIVKQKILKPHKGTHGYLTVDLSLNNKVKRLYIHRLVADAFLNKTKEQTQVNHKDLNKTNNSVDNLEWVTASENNHHMIKHNPQIRGENHKWSKLRESEVVELRKLRKKGMSFRKLGKRFNISGSGAYNVVNNCWRYTTS